MSPPGFSLLTGEAIVFETDEFGLPAVESQLVVNPHCLWSIGAAVLFTMDAIEDVEDFEAVFGGLAGQNSSFGRFRFVLLFFRWRKRVAAMRTGCVAGQDHGHTDRAFFQWGFATAC